MGIRKKIYKFIKTPRYKNEHRKKISVKEKLWVSRYYLIGIFLLFIISFTNKPLFILSVFLIFDIFRNILKCMIAYLPIDTSFYFLVVGSYFFSPTLGIIIYFVGLVNRFIFGHIESKHFTKTFRMILITYILPFFRGIDFLFVSISILIFNEILQIIIDLFIGEGMNLKNIAYYISHFSISILAFYLISLFRFYFV